MSKMGPVEKRVMEDIFQPEVLRERVPRMDEIQEGAEYVRALNNEIGTVGKFVRKGGFTPGRDFHRVAKIDSSIMAMIEDLHRAGCDCSREVFGNGGHKKFFFDWLEEHGQAYDVRVKISL